MSSVSFLEINIGNHINRSHKLAAHHNHSYNETLVRFTNM